MNDIVLQQLENRSKPIDVILVGLGFMGFGFLSSIRYLKGIRVPLLISRRVDESKRLLEEKGFRVSITSNVNEIIDYANQGYLCISDNPDLISQFENSIVIEMTGTVEYGTEIGLKTLNAGKHFITMNPELEVTVGSQLKAIADRKNVIITDVVGDQPGSLVRLIRNAQIMGFEILMAGNMKRYLDIHATQEKMKPWAEDKGLAVRQTTSFTDGTKQSIEMNLVANYFGMNVLKRGMVGPQVDDIKDMLKIFEWEKISKEGVVDYAIGMKLFPGIFVIATHKDPHQQKYLRYLNMGDGPYYVLFDPYHLCHLEVAQTIAKVALFGKETINNNNVPKAKTVTLAKRGLKKGDVLDGIGGDTVYGMVDTIENARDLLSIGFSKGAKVLRDIPQDEAIKIDDVDLPVNAATTLAGLVKNHEEKKSDYINMSVE